MAMASGRQRPTRDRQKPHTPPIGYWACEVGNSMNDFLQPNDISMSAVSTKAHACARAQRLLATG